MSELLFALRSGFGFLTTIPVGITMEGIEKLMKHLYLFPVIGLFIGLIVAAIGHVSSFAFHQLAVSLVVIVSIYSITGINHIDGLADFGDGIAAHGTREEKIKAMRDTAVGTGGAIFCMITLLGFFASLVAIQGEDALLLPFALIVAETSAKQAMVTVATFGKSLYGGFGAMTVENAKFSDFIAGMVFTGAVSYLVLGVFGLEAFIVSQLSGLIVLGIAKRNFGGVNGDVVGAANEVARVSALLFIGGTAWMLW